MVAQGRGSDHGWRGEKRIYFRRKSHLIYDANSYEGGLNNLGCVPPQQVVASHTIEEDSWEPSGFMLQNASGRSSAIQVQGG